MEYGILVAIAICLGGGVAGGLLAAWSCHHRILVLERNVQIYVGTVDDRLNMLSKIVTRQDKSEAAKVRWSKKETDDNALAQILTQGANSAPSHPWDPRTWGK